MKTISSPASSVDFSFLDLPSFRQVYTDARTPSKMRFYVRGMKCAKCVKKVEDIAMLDTLGARVQVFLGESLVEVTLIGGASGTQNSFAEVAKKIKELGYDPIPLEPHLGSQDEAIKEDRADIIRLAVMAACAGNIMTFAFAIYFGLSGVAADIFNWICFVLYLPVLFYGALPFYQGFWRSIRQKEMSIDGPMAVASVAGFVFSFINLVRGQGSIYFDSLSGFLFLILVSRYVQKRLQKKFLVPVSHFGAFEMNKARKIFATEATDWSWSLSQDLSAGDQILVLKNEVIPVDGWVVSDFGVLSLAYLTGESKPQVFQKGMKVKAGTQVLENDVVLRVEATGLGTQFGRLLEGLKRSSLTRVKVQDVSDRASQWLLWIVFSLAFVFLIGYWSINPVAAVERSLALLILACPCAMAFGTPLALAFSLKKAIRLGLILKSGDVFEKILQVENVFFDKTGTLTEGSLQVVRTINLQDKNANLSQLQKQLFLALEKISYHPIAFAIRKYFTDSAASSANANNNTNISADGQSLSVTTMATSVDSSCNSEFEEQELPLTDHYEKNGVGVFATFSSQQGFQKYGVQALASNEIAVVNQVIGAQNSSGFNESRHKMVGLYLWNSDSEAWALQAALQLELPLDPSAKATVQAFQKMGKNVYLVSGDENRLVRSLGDELGLDASHVFGEMNVEQKSVMVQSKAPAMMVGDGVNDALALRQAHVGVAVVGGVELALENASVFMTQSGVGALIQLYQISQQAHRLIRRNLTISLIYNLIGGTLALMGFVNPFVAAVLMPISSGFILLSSWFGGRD